MCMRQSRWLIALLSAVLLAGCYYPQKGEGFEVGYNFQVVGDSLSLRCELPVYREGILPLSSRQIVVEYDELLAVAEIKTVSGDAVDSVWVRLATNQGNQGWIRKSELLEGAVPDDPISRFIYFFSNNHLWPFVGLLVFALVVWLARKARHRRYPVVHLDDIASPFPMLLCLTLASSSVLYASIQLFVPSTWEYFYFHPTLNPFGLPIILELFIASLWFMVIFFGSALLDIYRCLRPVDAVLYTLSLSAYLCLLYVVFNVLTLYYVGYPLLLGYIFWAVWRYVRHHRARYVCGNCKAKMHSLGICPRCGMENV